MTRMRGLRAGVLVEFTHEDLGPVGGAIRSRITVEGEPPTDAVWVPTSVHKRLDVDLGVIVEKGFERSSIEYVDPDLADIGWQRLESGKDIPGEAVKGLGLTAAQHHLLKVIAGLAESDRARGDDDDDGMDGLTFQAGVFLALEAIVTALVEMREKAK